MRPLPTMAPRTACQETSRKSVAKCGESVARHGRKV
jgi:hypothetical protein